jgi:hypothetical protein
MAKMALRVKRHVDTGYRVILLPGIYRQKGIGPYF